jgi:hypothetical protein
MEYTVATELGEFFVISPGVVMPIAAQASVSITLSDHGVTLIAPSGEGD